MRTWTAILLVGTLFYLQGCVEKGASIAPLGKAEFVPQSPPDSVVESGIRQDPQTGGILLQWYKTAGASAYEIFRSDTTDPNDNPIQFSMALNVISSTVLNDTSAVDGLARTGKRYFYYIVAVSSDGSQGLPSDTISYELINRPSLIAPVNGSAVQRTSTTFGWVNTSGGYTVIRVEDLTVTPVAPVWVSKRFQTFAQYPSVAYDFDSASTQQLIPEHSYRWRVGRFGVDAAGRLYEGSTSTWGTFTVN